MTEKYSLRRVGDNKGQDGRYSHAVAWNEDNTFKEEVGIRPTVGCSHMVQMGLNTYWLTTTVTEILEDTPDMVRFKTKNSEYIWKQNSQLQSDPTS